MSFNRTHLFSGKEHEVEKRNPDAIFPTQKCKTPIPRLRTGLVLPNRLLGGILVQWREPERQRSKAKCLKDSCLQRTTSLRFATDNMEGVEMSKVIGISTRLRQQAQGPLWWGVA